jgi:hypothetical protein
VSFSGATCKADHELPERRAVPSRNMASNSVLGVVSRSGASRRDRQMTGEPFAVRMRRTVLWRNLRWTPVGRVSSGNSGSRL